MYENSITYEDMEAKSNYSLHEIKIAAREARTLMYEGYCRTGHASERIAVRLDRLDWWQAPELHKSGCATLAEQAAYYRDHISNFKIKVEDPLVYEMLPKNTEGPTTYREELYDA